MIINLIVVISHVESWLGVSIIAAHNLSLWPSSCFMFAEIFCIFEIKFILVCQHALAEREVVLWDLESSSRLAALEIPLPSVRTFIWHFFFVDLLLYYFELFS